MNEEPIYKTCSDGTKSWRLPSNGFLHHEILPACEYIDGTKEWFLNGKTSRMDGPAIEFYNGDKHWYIDGDFLEPEKAIKDPELQVKHPKLIEAMIIWLVHES